jgi:hypothetical protein
VVGAASLERRKPAAEAVELIRRQLSDRIGDFFDFHAGQYSTARGPVEPEGDWLRTRCRGRRLAV